MDNILYESPNKIKYRKNKTMVPFKKLEIDSFWKNGDLNDESFNKYKNNYNIFLKPLKINDEDIPLINEPKEDENINHPEINVNDQIDTTHNEKSLNILLQIFFPYLVAGFGTVGAGMVLDVVQHWKVFIEVRELFILVPALLGLKGNLEMTLASRLSTQANLFNKTYSKSVLLNTKKQNNLLSIENSKYAKQNGTVNLHDEKDISNQILYNELDIHKDDSSIIIKDTSNLSIKTKNKPLDWHVWSSIITGNLSLIQGQASVIGFLAAFTAIIMGWIPEGHFDINNSKILFASSILTASIASAILGS